MPHGVYGGVGKNAGKGPGRTSRRGKGSKLGKAPTRGYETSKVTSFENQVKHVKSAKRPPAFVRARGKV